MVIMHFFPGTTWHSFLNYIRNFSFLHRYQPSHCFTPGVIIYVYLGNDFIHRVKLRGTDFRDADNNKIFILSATDVCRKWNLLNFCPMRFFFLFLLISCQSIIGQTDIKYEILKKYILISIIFLIIGMG